MKKLIQTLLILVVLSPISKAQSDMELIHGVLTDYIEGTANGQKERLDRAFHPDFNLYFVSEDRLNVWSGKEYVGNIKEGSTSNRIGRIINIDHEGDAASAKVEIIMPSRKRIYTDYFLLLKVKGAWKVIHKSFTYRDYPN